MVSLRCSSQGRNGELRSQRIDEPGSKAWDDTYPLPLVLTPSPSR
jgi:hypothetical protein